MQRSKYKLNQISKKIELINRKLKIASIINNDLSKSIRKQGNAYVMLAFLVLQIGGGLVKELVESYESLEYDIQYLKTQLESYISEYSKSDPTYNNNKKQFDKLLSDISSVQSNINKVKLIDQKINLITEDSIKTDPSGSRKKLEEISEEIQQDISFLQEFESSTGEIGTLLSSTRSSAGNILDFSTRIIGVDWVPGLSTFATKIQEVSGTIYSKLQKILSSLKEEQMRLDETVKKLPKEADSTLDTTTEKPESPIPTAGIAASTGNTGSVSSDASPELKQMLNTINS